MMIPCGDCGGRGYEDAYDVDEFGVYSPGGKCKFCAGTGLVPSAECAESEKSKREAYIRASDRRVAKWPEAKREAFQKAVDRITKPLQTPPTHS